MDAAWRHSEEHSVVCRLCILPPGIHVSFMSYVQAADHLQHSSGENITPC
jgi:hypothetical protein